MISSSSGSGVYIDIIWVLKKTQHVHVERKRMWKTFYLVGTFKKVDKQADISVYLNNLPFSCSIIEVDKLIHQYVMLLSSQGKCNTLLISRFEFTYFLACIHDFFFHFIRRFKFICRLLFMEKRRRKRHEQTWRLWHVVTRLSNTWMEL